MMERLRTMRVKVIGLGRSLVPLLLVASFSSAASDLPLVDAIEKGNREAVRSLVEAQTDVNAREADGATALAWAVYRDDLEIVELLIRAGADVNAANDYGVTPLSLACTNGNSAIAQKLLTAGADSNASLPSGETVLMTCSRTGSLDAVKALLASGASVNAKESVKQQTALMWAIAQKQPEVARVLIASGADIHAHSAGGFTPILFAARAGDVECARVLLEAGANVNETTPDGMSVLLLATVGGQESLAIVLLEMGADPNAADADGVTALHYAIQKGLTILGAVQNVPVAYYMFRPSMLKLAKALLAHGANPNARIAKAKRLSLAVSARASMAGATPFLLAAAAVDLNAMRLLAANGADPLLATKENTTPLMVAAGMGRLQDHVTEQEKKSALEAVKLALELGADVNAVNDNGRGALHGAASVGVNAIVQFLVDNGAKVDAKDKWGLTPWNIAAAVIPEGGLGSDKLRPVHKEAADLLLKLAERKSEGLGAEKINNRENRSDAAE